MEYDVSIIKPYSLLYKSHGDYQDLETGIIYPTKLEYHKGDYMIDKDKSSLLCFQSVIKGTENKVVMEKGKVLEKYRSIKWKNK